MLKSSTMYRENSEIHYAQIAWNVLESFTMDEENFENENALKT